VLRVPSGGWPNLYDTVKGATPEAAPGASRDANHPAQEGDDPSAAGTASL
jgi:hypothetical protein